MPPLDGPFLEGLFIWYLIFLLSLTVHEAAHALVALWGGDDTAYQGGQVSLNPWPHMRREPIGMVVIPLVTYLFSGLMMGWASAPYNPVWGMRYPRRQAAMAAAGPAANLILAFLAFLVLKLLLLGGVLAVPQTAGFDHLAVPAAQYSESSWAAPLVRALSIALNLNLLLCLFNLIPLPPLDGSGILSGLFRRRLGSLYRRLAEEPMLSTLGILAAWKLFSYRPVSLAVLSLLHPHHFWG
jgi:Zn-dependent protease